MFGRSLATWGDGLIEGSLSTLWYPVNWHSVDDDELVFINPALLESDSQGRILQLVDHALQKAATQLDSTTDIEAACAAPNIKSPPASRTAWGLLRRPAPRDVLLSSLAVLTLRLYRNLIVSNTSDCATDDIFAALASFFSGVNCGYVSQNQLLNQQTMTLATWLGVIRHGRPALMPSFIAEAIDLCDIPETREVTLESVLHFLMDISLGRDLAREKAAQVLRDGETRVVRPRRAGLTVEQTRFCSELTGCLELQWKARSS